MSEVQMYLAEAGRGRVLGREEEVELFQQLEAGQEWAREEIVACNLRFVIKIALAYRGLGVPLADLIQEGNIGLLHVVDKFDWRRGFRFSTYAAFYIRQEIQASVYRQSSMIRLPIRKARLLGRLQEVTRKHVEANGIEPSTAELAALVGHPEATVVSLLGMRHSFTSLDGDAEEDSQSLSDVLADDVTPAPDAAISQRQTRAAVVDLMEFLTEREREVLSLRYGFSTGRSQSLRKASKVVGLSQEGVRRVEHRALSKLRRPSIAHRVEGLLTA